jgi:hypothetical protein
MQASPLSYARRGYCKESTQDLHPCIKASTVLNFLPADAVPRDIEKKWQKWAI